MNEQDRLIEVGAGRFIDLIGDAGLWAVEELHGRRVLSVGRAL